MTIWLVIKGKPNIYNRHLYASFKGQKYETCCINYYKKYLPEKEITLTDPNCLTVEKTNSINVKIVKLCCVVTSKYSLWSVDC